MKRFDLYHSLLIILFTTHQHQSRSIIINERQLQSVKLVQKKTAKKSAYSSIKTFLGIHLQTLPTIILKYQSVTVNLINRYLAYFLISQQSLSAIINYYPYFFIIVNQSQT